MESANIQAHPGLRQSFKTGLSFGLTSGIITTLGLMVGLHAGTHSRIVVLGGILTIAIADAMSDALGIHLAEEARSASTTRHIWEATLATFLGKLLVALTFVLPVLLLPLTTAIAVSVLWGLSLLSLLSLALARAHGTPAWKVIGEHLIITVGVVALSHLVGDLSTSWVTAVGNGP